MATDQKVGGSNPLTHVGQRSREIVGDLPVFSVIQDMKLQHTNIQYTGGRMDRQQFIDTLERTLRGGGTPEHIIADNVRYYNGYFADESAKGRSEAEIEIGRASCRERVLRLV